MCTGVGKRVLVNLNQWTGGHGLGPCHKSEVLCLCVESPLAQPPTLGTCMPTIAVPVYSDHAGTVELDVKFLRSPAWCETRNRGLGAEHMEV